MDIVELLSRLIVQVRQQLEDLKNHPDSNEPEVKALVAMLEYHLRRAERLISYDFDRE